MKKILSFALAICLLVTMLCGCDILEELSGPSIGELVAELWHEMTHEVTDIYKEIYQTITDGIKNAIKRKTAQIFNSYEKAMKKDWETLITSTYGNEVIKVQYRHKANLFVHRMYFMITLEQDGVCTYYTPPQSQRCLNCSNGDHGTLKGVSSKKEIYEKLYPYLSDMIGCFVLTQLEQGKITSQEIQEATINDLFNTLGHASISSIHSSTFGAAFGVLVEPVRFASELNDLAGYISDGVDVQEHFTSALSPDYRYDPIVTAFVDSFGLATDIIHSSNPMIYLNLEKMTHTAADWEPLISLEELSPDGRKLNFQVTDTHLQWKFEDEESWQNLTAFDDLPRGDHEVAFMITGTDVQWRPRTKSEVYLNQLQAIFHGNFRFIAYPVG